MLCSPRGISSQFHSTPFLARDFDPIHLLFERSFARGSGRGAPRRWSMDVAMVALAEGVRGGEVHSYPMAEKNVDQPVRVPGKEQCEEEIESLVRLFNEEDALYVVARYRRDRDALGNIQRKKIAVFLEGSRLPFSALAKDIFERLNAENDQDEGKNGAVTMALVKSSVLSLGERLSFGVTSPDADVLEDDNRGSLWCWEARDMKLLPRPFHDVILDRRRWRRNIGERITALSATPNAQRSVSLAALDKADDESPVRAAKVMWQEIKSGTSPPTNSNPPGEQPSSLTQEALSSRKRKSDPEEKERIRQEKLMKREQMESEKEQKRKEKEEADRKRQQQKQQDEAEKEQKRKEKEEVERKKQERKQLDEAEKEQKREAERKKQLALKKQASFMDRFLVRKDPLKDAAKSQQAGCGQTQQQAEPQVVSSSSPVAEWQKHKSATPSGQSPTVVVVARMDEELKCCDVPIDSEELLRSHVHNWLRMRSRSASSTPQRWGVRRKPKGFVYRELRLSGTVGDSRGNSQDDGQVRKGDANSSPVSHFKRTREEFDSPGLDGDWKENVVECLSPTSPLEEGKKSATSRYHQLRKKKRKLIQFDKGHRPPYYGTFSKKSEFIKPRHPWKQDPALDYEVDSDEEWEEEDPGESLSDVEKDEEDEKGEIEEIEDDEDGPDEFVVPDGYLSEEEGVAIEHSERNFATAGGSSATESPVTPVSQSLMSLERLRKVLDNATEHAIRSNHPLVISNLGQLPGCDPDTSASQFPSNRTETLCLEALRMRVLVPNLLIGAC